MFLQGIHHMAKQFFYDNAEHMNCDIVEREQALQERRLSKQFLIKDTVQEICTNHVITGHVHQEPYVTSMQKLEGCDHHQAKMHTPHLMFSVGVSKCDNEYSPLHQLQLGGNSYSLPVKFSYCSGIMPKILASFSNIP